MIIPAENDNKQAAKKGVTFFFGDSPHRRRDRGLERPDFYLESIWLHDRRPSTVPFLLMQKRDAQMEVCPA